MPRATPRTDSIESVAADAEREARRAPFDVCAETYRAAGRDPWIPILCAGEPSARWCAVGRELGREEVHAGEPLVGMGGRRLRRALHETLLGPAPAAERRFAGVLARVFLANLVPFRPVDNEAYDRATVERFRPFLERLLADVWTGDVVLSLGKESTLWFSPYAANGAVAALWADADGRFRDTVDVTIRGRRLVLAPVPHPSPLSPFKKEFASLVAWRIGTKPGGARVAGRVLDSRR
jgi:uracil-DNA glycosylase